MLKYLHGLIEAQVRIVEQLLKQGWPGHVLLNNSKPQLLKC